MGQELLRPSGGRAEATRGAAEARALERWLRPFVRSGPRHRRPVRTRARAAWRGRLRFPLGLGAGIPPRELVAIDDKTFIVKGRSNASYAIEAAAKDSPARLIRTTGHVRTKFVLTE